ncbi:hypothetical protein PCL_02633 [Purpureocillium lilacinum]|uniref:Uncharacterized protein n=1 Tax=Purpureocillium lilacinum TaxID=33203 RepID=A0A2U3DZP7_PURLI|nr:hypothetical protein Purlil1_10078 [Purpureocillium lilacinum]PWI67712.1 hypothetical protein PCL_02633 [Purpureocillium lilacinum]
MFSLKFERLPPPLRQGGSLRLPSCDSPVLVAAVKTWHLQRPPEPQKPPPVVLEPPSRRSDPAPLEATLSRRPVNVNTTPRATATSTRVV